MRSLLQRQPSIARSHRSYRRIQQVVTRFNVGYLCLNLEAIGRYRKAMADPSAESFRGRWKLVCCRQQQEKRVCARRNPDEIYVVILCAHFAFVFSNVSSVGSAWSKATTTVCENIWLMRSRPASAWLGSAAVSPVWVSSGSDGPNGFSLHFSRWWYNSKVAGSWV